MMMAVSVSAGILGLGFFASSMTGFGKGFGCRPEHERSTRHKAGVRKPPKNEPAGKR
jgi:hypothetical protein